MKTARHIQRAVLTLSAYNAERAFRVTDRWSPVEIGNVVGGYADRLSGSY